MCAAGTGAEEQSRRDKAVSRGPWTRPNKGLGKSSRGGVYFNRGAVRENKLLPSKYSLSLLALMLLEKNKTRSSGREAGGGESPAAFARDGSVSVSAPRAKGLKSFSLKFKFQPALTLPSPSFERLTGNHFIFQSRQNKLN